MTTQVERLAGSLVKANAEIERQAAEIERLTQTLAAKDDLLVAYRLGDQRLADKALTRLAALNEKEPDADAKPPAPPEDASNHTC